MENYKDLLGESAALFAKAKAAVEGGAAEELEHVQAMIAEAQAKKQKAMQLQSISDGLADVAMRIESGQKADEAKQARKDPTQFKDFGEFLHAAWWALHPENRKGADGRLQRFRDLDEEKSTKQMSEGVGAEGGFLVPLEQMSEMLAVDPEMDIVQSRATVIRMRRRQVAIPVLDQTGTTANAPHWFGGFTFYWGEEGAEKTHTEAKFRQIRLTANKLYGYTYASDELVDDSAVSLSDFMGGPLGFAGGVRWMRDYAFLRGTGNGMPLGVVNAGATINVPATGSPPDPGSLYGDLVDMLENFLPSGRGMWVINQRHMSDLLEMSGPSSNPSYLWGNAAAGVPTTLLGLPVKFTEKLPAPGSNGSILLADFRYYLVGDRQAATIESTKYDRWKYDQTSWRVVDRCDGQPWLSAPLTLADGTAQVSPFVILGAKST